MWFFLNKQNPSGSQMKLVQKNKRKFAISTDQEEMMQQPVLTSKALEDKSSIKEQYGTWAHLQGWGEKKSQRF